MSDATSLRIGWIGTGVMGAAMAGHLLGRGHRLTVHSRTRSRAQALLDRGAAWADSPAAAADGMDLVISMVGFPADVEDVHLGAGGTLTAAALPGMLIDMTTSRPSLARRIAEEAAAKGVGAVDAPVSGGDVGARNATLSIMVGAEPDVFERAKPVLAAMGSKVVLQGGPGAGQHTKMVNQILIASNMMGVCEALLYAGKAGLSAETVLESVSAGAAGSWSLSNLAPRMLVRNFEPGFYIEHFIKDLGIALDEAEAMGLALPGLALAKQLYLAAKAQGLGRKGTQALLVMLEGMNAMENGPTG